MLRVTYIGHATLLIEVGGKRLLTDPNFDPALGRFLPRVSTPGIALAALPKLDAILLTHAHADHLSFDSLDALPRDIPLYAPPAVARWLVRQGYSHSLPVAAGECVGVEDGVTIRAASAAHRGNRYGVDRWRSATNMYLIDTKTVSCFFAGDTALVADTTQLVESHLTPTGRILDLALLPIGHAPWWKPGFRKGHLTSADALTLFERLKARYLIPYHWGTFNHVTSTAFDAIDRLRSALGTHPLRSAVRILEPGEAFALPVEES
jgi:L-ascorbate metabolism protein UlaG (beta-lactamase superfamily)